MRKETNRKVGVVYIVLNFDSVRIEGVYKTKLGALMRRVRLNSKSFADRGVLEFTVKGLSRLSACLLDGLV